MAMDKFVINGGARLKGKVTVSGSKNAALPILAAALLAEGESVIHDVPELEDIAAMIDLLRDLGVDAKRDGRTLRLRVRDESNVHAPYERVRKMRASICVLGPLLAKRRRPASPCPADARSARAR